MKTLLIMRHAKSSWSNRFHGDHDRPLNGRGQRDAPRMGDLLRREALVPDVIISSDAERARQTAEQVMLTAEMEGELRTTREFYLADPETYIELLQRLEADFDCVMIVGHNPGMEMLVSQLTGVDERLTTANIAHVRLPIDHWQQLDDDTTGDLCQLWRPRELPGN